MIIEHLHYQPKGGMCATCVHKLEDCTHLHFEAMQKIGKGDADGTVIVKCMQFKNESTAAKHAARYSDLVKRGLAKPQSYDIAPIGGSYSSPDAVPALAKDRKPIQTSKPLR